MMQALWNRRNSDEGFTLVEMLVVIAIIGILAAVAVFAMGGTAKTSKTAACKSDVATVQTASDAYFAKNNSYALTPAALVPDFLRSAPPLTNGYVISIPAGGGVISTPACADIT